MQDTNQKLNRNTIFEQSTDSTYEVKKTDETLPANENDQPSPWENFILTRFTRTL